MSFLSRLSFQNMKRRPARTAALILISAFLSFSVFGGSVMIRSLQKGLSSYEERLGADIVVVPNQARSHGTLDDILLQGIPGYFYMDISNLEKIRNIEGVEIASPQFYLASASAGCCSVAVQIIGFDPETDFSIQPWIKESFSGSMGEGDIIVGADIEIPSSHILKFFNEEYNVVAKLDKTGTGLDSAVYANMDTIHRMMDGSLHQGFDYTSDISADRAISSVMIRVADGYDIEKVTGDINVHVRRVEATQAKNMVSGIAGGLSSVSGVIGVLLAVIWVLSVCVLVVVFMMIANERVKEYAVLRVVGASEGMLKRLTLTEASLTGLFGALAGAVLSALIVLPFTSLIKNRLELPYLLPNAWVIAVLFLVSVLLAVLVGAFGARTAVARILESDTGLVLREDK